MDTYDKKDGMCASVQYMQWFLKNPNPKSYTFLNSEL